MKNLFIIAALLLSFNFVSAQTSTTIGTCKFVGKQPRSSNVVGRMQYYHDGSVKRTKMEGNKDVYTGNGDVWVIFKSREAAAKAVFRVTGNVQICNDF